MKKFFFLILLVVSCLSLVVGQWGCGQTNPPTDTTTTTTSTTSSSTTSTTIAVSAGGITSISGTLSSGVLSSSMAKGGIKSQAIAYGVLPSYTVTAVSKNSGMIYFSSQTDSSGSFTISNLPSQEAFYLQVLDSSNRLVAPVAFGASNGAVMAITASSDALTALNLGTIVYDASENSAAPSTTPTSYFDSSTTVEAKTGKTLVPKGAGNFGKGTVSQFTGTYDPSKVDGDKDGLPNMVDTDNNGDLIIDDFDGLSTLETLSAASTKIKSSIMWTNVKVPYGSSVAGVVNTATGYWLTIAVDSKPGYTISSVTLESGPTWKANAKIHTNNSADGGSTWQSVGYKLYPTPDGASFRVMLGGVEITPGTIVKAGDILTFIVTFSDGSTEKIAKMINFAFADVPKLKAYYFGQWTNTSQFISTYLPSGQSNNMLIESPVNTNHFSLKWEKATDESGSYIEGARYAWEVVQGSYIYPQVTTEVGSAYVYGYANLAPYVLSSATTFACSIGMVNSMGDNAVQNCGFYKTTTWGTTEVSSP